MCGIFGHYTFDVPQSRGAILETLFEGLRRLEYRGYDSAGIAVDSDECVRARIGTSLERRSLVSVNVNVDASEGTGSREKGKKLNDRD